MISLLKLLSVALAGILLFSCVERSTEVTTEKLLVSEVSGFCQVGDARLNFVEGIIHVSPGPDGWEDYSIICILRHNHFSLEEMAQFKDELFVHPTKSLSVPEGEAWSSAQNDSLFPPYVRVELGRWPRRMAPVVDPDRILLRYRNFPDQACKSSGVFRVAEGGYVACDIDANDNVTVDLHLSGESGDRKWSIKFRGVSGGYYNQWHLWK